MSAVLLRSALVLALVHQASLVRAAEPPATEPPAAEPSAAEPSGERPAAASAPPGPLGGAGDRAVEAPPADSRVSAPPPPPNTIPPQRDASVTAPPPPAAASAAPPTARNQDVSEPLDDGVLGSHQLHFYAGLGFRTSWIDDRGFQPFSTDTELTQFSVTFGRVLLTEALLSFGLGVAWDYGVTSATVRNSPTELSIHRVTLMPEVRYHLVRRLYAFGRVGAGVAVFDASYSDAIAAVERTQSQAAFTVDPALGAAFEVFGTQAGRARQPRLWLLADAGYLFTSNMDLELSSDAESPARMQPLRLGELGLRGVTLRAMAALTF